MRADEDGLTKVSFIFRAFGMRRPVRDVVGFVGRSNILGPRAVLRGSGACGVKVPWPSHPCLDNRTGPTDSSGRGNRSVGMGSTVVGSRPWALEHLGAEGLHRFHDPSRNDESCTVIYKRSESILANIFSVSASANGCDGDRTRLYFE